MFTSASSSVYNTPGDTAWRHSSTERSVAVVDPLARGSLNVLILVFKATIKAYCINIP